MNERRPDPDRLLERLHEQQELERRAKLKIFFGASAGVGKTYAMLVEAHERKRSGVDVVVGVVETHGRPETAALLDGLEMLPRRGIDYRGTTQQEFDLDAVLARNPKLVLLDELAHTNLPGSRHAKRWQDVAELLEAGIDVYTTLNVQHVESLWDIVAQITGVRVRETVPDSILDRADEVELVDLPPDDLLQRLREGKVYVSEQVARAFDNFFQKGNLIALRELALRQTAERVDAQMESYRRAHGIAGGWPAGGRIVVCLGDPKYAPRLVRAARRMAVGLRADWIVVHVERPGEATSREVRDQLVDVMGFAEELGAETAILSGHRVSDEILEFARSSNASRIVVGKPSRPPWLERLFGSLVNSLVRESGEIDVYVIRGEPEGAVSRPPVRTAPARIGVRPYLRALGVVVAATVVAAIMNPWFDQSNLVMVYLIGVAWAAAREGRAASVVASILSVLAFDFFFVPPSYTFAISDTQYLVTFGVMLFVGLVISTMAARLQDQAYAARRRERHAAALYKLSRELAARRDSQHLLETALAHIQEVFDSRAIVLLPDASGSLAVTAGDPALLGPGQHERGVAQWVFDNGQPAGLGTDTLPGSQCLFLPLRASRGEIGVIGIQSSDVNRLLAPESFQLLGAFVSQTALALERGLIAQEAERTQLEAEKEQLRNALLSSVSHDLRTPLAVITGAASSLLVEEGALQDERAREMAETIAGEALRLNRLVGNLLQMTRLEAGALEVNKGWHPLEEVVGAALERLEPQLGGRTVTVHLPEGLPLVPLDDVLIEQVLFNLVENAHKHTPPGTEIEIRATVDHSDLVVEIADRGPGLAPGEEERVFEKFQRGAGEGRTRGFGLGLAIVRGIVEAHGGAIRASRRTGGGAVFRFTLPLQSEPPRLEPEAIETGPPAKPSAS